MLKISNLLKTAMVSKAKLFFDQMAKKFPGDKLTSLCMTAINKSNKGTLDPHKLNNLMTIATNTTDKVSRDRIYTDWLKKIVG